MTLRRCINCNEFNVAHGCKCDEPVQANQPAQPLLPCPWCNQVPAEVHSGKMESEKRPRFWVECINPDCSLTPHTRYYHEKTTAANTWNQRTSTTTREVLEELELALKENLAKWDKPLLYLHEIHTSIKIVIAKRLEGKA